MVLHTKEKEKSVWMHTVGSGLAFENENEIEQLWKASNESIKHPWPVELRSDGTCYSGVEMTYTVSTNTKALAHWKEDQGTLSLPWDSWVSCISPGKDEKGLQLFFYLLQAFKKLCNLRCVMFLEHKHSTDVDKTEEKNPTNEKTKEKKKTKPK